MISIFSISTTTPGIQTISPALLHDGFVLQGVDGTLTGNDSNDAWSFKLNSDVTDDKVIIKAGTSLKLLPSATLENMITDANERSESHYLLWGTVTKYKGTNFIFPNYFSPLKISPRPQTPPEEKQDQNEPQKSSPTEGTVQKPAINDPNDLLTIPQEIIEKLKAARDKTPPSAQRSTDSSPTRDTLQRKTQNEQRPPIAEETPTISAKSYSQNIDSVLVDRTAFLDRQENNELLFVLDGFGRNVPQASYQLLPCEVLELTEQRQFAVPEPVRFKIAGIVTKYKGNEYLLLQKATRIYSHGNFGR
jgi:hypothetical protein